MTDGARTPRIAIAAATAVVLLLAAAAGLAPAARAAEAGGGAPSLFAAVRGIERVAFCGEEAPLDSGEVRERLEKELLLTVWDRPQVVLWIKRSPRFMPLIESMLREAGLPEDLKYIAVAESALRAHAGSRRGAIGYWQFMPATARRYGLKVDSEKDERRNISRSTEAAIAYLKELYGMFGSWTLAAAAYNMGEEGLASEIAAQRTEDFYKLYLPLETQRYVFRILAAKLILEDPGRFGFRFEPADLYPPLNYAAVTVECFRPTPIRLVAEAAGTFFKTIKDLNPELRGYYLEAGVHRLLVPPEGAEGFSGRFRRLAERWVEQREQRVYVVREGDSLTSIAERFGVPIKALVIWNRLQERKYIHPGDRLVILPPATGDEQAEAAGDGG